MRRMGLFCDLVQQGQISEQADKATTLEAIEETVCDAMCT
jgi:hypothetical protein